MASDPLFPNIQYVSTATAYYNCHSYAWHSMTPGRKWIDRDMFYQGNMLYGVERYFNYEDHCTSLGSNDSSAQINDIIVYRRNGVITHSGIVVGTNPIKIKSKWGKGSVWIHDKNVVPNSYKEPSGAVNATYYRYSRTHSYQYSSTGSSMHKKECSVCHQYTNESHNLTYTPKNNSKHRVNCPLCGYTREEVHLFLENPNVCSFCGYTSSLKNPDGVIGCTEDHDHDSENCLHECRFDYS